jgi:hypothetical protein
MAMNDGPNFEALSLLGVCYKTAASSSTRLINVCHKGLSVHVVRITWT